MSSVTLRPPTFSKAKQPANHQNPTVLWLNETWNVTHSTLPMWKSKRNVQIQYTPLEPSSTTIKSENTDRIDDHVTYQGLKSAKIQSVKGVDTAASPGDQRGEWNWRGKGLLKIASSHWEILGWGKEDGSENKWVITIFAKTLFTPAGIDIYSKARAGLKPETLESIKKALQAIDDEDVNKMAMELFEITVDDARKE